MNTSKIYGEICKMKTDDKVKLFPKDEKWKKQMNDSKGVVKKHTQKTS